jgi:hypothetical protein
MVLIRARMVLLLVALFGVNIAASSGAHAQSCPPGYYPATAAGDSGGLSNCMPYSSDDGPDRTAPAPRRPSWKSQWGAIAISEKSPEYGASWSYGSKSSAQRSAIKACKARDPEGGPCKVLFAYHDQCVALARGDGGYLASGALTTKLAVEDAYRSCSEATTNCQIIYTECSYPVQR